MSGIFEAIESGDLERVRAIVTERPEAAGARDEQGVSALLQARYRGRDDLVGALLAARTELDVFEASAVGDVERVRELVEADPALVDAFAPDGFTPLTLAAHFGHEDVVRLLLDRGADVALRARHEQIQVQPLHAAAATGQTAIVRLLLDAGAPVNEVQPGGFTALHAAAQNGNAELARLLIERGADPEQPLDDGRTPRDLAREHPDVASALG